MNRRGDLDIRYHPVPRMVTTWDDGPQPPGLRLRGDVRLPGAWAPLDAVALGHAPAGRPLTRPRPVLPGGPHFPPPGGSPDGQAPVPHQTGAGGTASECCETGATL